jgi:hypothetical protein
MYGYPLLTSREHDEPITVEHSVAEIPEAAIARAKSRIVTTKISIPHPIDILIFDAEGATLLH